MSWRWPSAARNLLCLWRLSVQFRTQIFKVSKLCRKPTQIQKAPQSQGEFLLSQSLMQWESFVGREMNRAWENFSNQSENWSMCSFLQILVHHMFHHVTYVCIDKPLPKENIKARVYFQVTMWKAITWAWGNIWNPREIRRRMIFVLSTLPYKSTPTLVF